VCLLIRVEGKVHFTCVDLNVNVKHIKKIQFIFHSFYQSLVARGSLAQGSFWFITLETQNYLLLITFNKMRKRTKKPLSLSFSPPIWYEDDQLLQSPVYRTTRKEKIERVSNLGIYYLVESIQKDQNVCIISKKELDEEKYTTKIQGEFNIFWSQGLMLDPETNFEKIKKIMYEGYLRIHPDLYNKMKNCLENNSKKIILLPFSVYGYAFPDRDILVDEDIKGYSRDSVKLIGHRVMIIINKYLKTIEFYDSNGSEPHLQLFGNYDYTKVSAFLLEQFPEYFVDEKYELLSYADTCPKYAFQYFEGLESRNEQFELGGFCQFWSIFNAHMRIKYPKIPAKKLQEDILKKMREKRPGGYLSKFIKNYTIFLQKLID
jgi:hypothetical protein